MLIGCEEKIFKWSHLNVHTMSVIIPADNANGHCCTNSNYIHTETICMSNGLILNFMTYTPTEGPSVSSI